MLVGIAFEGLFQEDRDGPAILMNATSSEVVCWIRETIQVKSTMMQCLMHLLIYSRHPSYSRAVILVLVEGLMLLFLKLLVQKP